MENLIIGIICSTILAVAAYIKKKFTLTGTIVAWILAIVITYCGGYQSFIILFVFFLTAMIAGRISRVKRDHILNDINQKHGTRDAVQVFANIGIATISLVIYYFTKNDIFYLAYACVIAASLADTLASELGVLSKDRPINIVTLKKIKRGMSGGITGLGLRFSLLGSFLVGITYYFLNDFSFIGLILITILGFVGSVADSLCGALIQVKYQCRVCGKMTEKIHHCHETTEYISGFRIVNNDVVNFLNNIIVFIFAIVIQKFI